MLAIPGYEINHFLQCLSKIPAQTLRQTMSIVVCTGIKNVPCFIKQ